MKKLILLLYTVNGIQHGRHCGVIGHMAEKKHSNIFFTKCFKERGNKIKTSLLGYYLV
jgi:hypothetical protein